MKTLYLPYEREFDEETGTWCLTGKDAEGLDFGVAAADTIELAEERLKAWILDSVSASAGDGQDRLGDLADEEPSESSIALQPLDIVPIRLRLIRTRHGYSQARMGEILGISQQAYAKLEQPGANLQLRTIQQVEGAMNEDLLQLA